MRAAGEGARLALHHPPQGFAAARQARHHRAQGDLQHLGGLLIAHAFQADEEDDLLLLRRQCVEGAREVPQLKGYGLGCRARQACHDLIEINADAGAPPALKQIYIGIGKNRKKISAQIPDAVPEVTSRKRALQALLHQLVRIVLVPQQRPGIAAQIGNVALDAFSGMSHGSSPSNGQTNARTSTTDWRGISCGFEHSRRETSWLVTKTVSL